MLACLISISIRLGHYAGTRAPPLPAYDAVERFRQAMFDAGLRPDEIADTSGLAMPERCPVADDRPGKKSGWYVFYGDGVSAGAFGNWKTGEEWKWSGKSQSTMTSAEREQFAQKMARAKRVLTAQFQASGHAEQELGRHVAGTHDLDHAGFAGGDGAGLIQQHSIGVAGGFQAGGGLEQDAVLGPYATATMMATGVASPKAQGRR